jgi:DNA-binding winged helix-turn-helix (wHTH) protein
MAETEPHLRHLRFGIFEVDLRSGELRKAGVKLKLGGQPFQLLTVLLERPGEVVTREELQKRLWPDTFVDVDHNLNTAINKIREVLGDSADSPRYVETLPRRGYRFIATVTGDTVPAKQLVEKIVPLKPKLTRRPLYYAVATAGLTAVVVGSLMLWRADFRTRGAPKVLRFTKLTNDGQAKIGPIVTDGSRIYFAILLFRFPSRGERPFRSRSGSPCLQFSTFRKTEPSSW